MMLYVLCFFSSVCLFVVGVLTASIWLSVRQKKQPEAPIGKYIHYLFITVFCAFYVLSIPISHFLYSGAFETIALSGISTVKAFAMGAGFSDFTHALASAPPSLIPFYSAYAALLFVLAPIMSISFLLSFFKQFSLKIKLFFGWYHALYVFSELNQESLALAESCIRSDKEKHLSSLAVFADSDSKTDSVPHHLNAILFKTSIVELNCLKRTSRGKDKLVFIMDSNETKKTNTILELAKKYQNDETMQIFFFDNSPKGNIVIGSAVSNEMKPFIRRVDVTRSLVYNYLYHTNIFQSIYTDPDGKKHLNIMIFGLGDHGEEFLKAYLWAGQMPDLALRIDVFDISADAQERFYAKCPEIKKMNGAHLEADARFDLEFHVGFDVKLYNFDDVISQAYPPSTIFVCLQDDALNTEVAIKLRVACSRKFDEFTPQIAAIIKDPAEAEIVNHVLLKNEAGSPYQITALGDRSTTYSTEVIMGAELENAAIERHFMSEKPSDPNELRSRTAKLLSYEYNLKSSIAAVIRKKLQTEFGVKGIDKPITQRTPEEKELIRKTEHIGWNNYMRCEGYIYREGTKDPYAKTHPCLIPYDQLPAEERTKDDL